MPYPHVDARIPLSLVFGPSTPSISASDYRGAAQERQIRQLKIEDFKQRQASRQALREAFGDYFGVNPQEAPPPAEANPGGARDPFGHLAGGTAVPKQSQPPQGNRLGDVGRAGGGAPSEFLTDPQKRLLSEVGQIDPQRAFELEGHFLKQHEAEFKRRRQQMESQYAQIVHGRALIKGTTDQESYERNIATFSQLYGPESVADLPQLYDPAVLAQKDQELESLQGQYEMGLFGAELAQKQLEDDVARQGKVRDQAALMAGEVEEARRKAEATGQSAREERQARAQELRAKAADRQATQAERGNEATLRKEFNDLTKDFRTVRDAWGKINASADDPSAAGDLSLIFAYMKLLDPTSVVREGEFATAQNAGGVPERIVAAYNRVLSGERLAPEIRKDFVDRGKRLYTQYVSDYQSTRNQYRSLAQRQGVNPDNVTLEFESTVKPSGGGVGEPSDEEILERYRVK